MIQKYSRRDIHVYRSSKYYGFHTFEKTEELFSSYRNRAVQAAEMIDWDEIILYAIYRYDAQTSAVVSAEFMILRMPYFVYRRLTSKLAPECRLFILKGRKDLK